MFRIGEFSQLVKVSPRMLRHYEKCGVFYPAEIDRGNGYCLYSSTQVPLLIDIIAEGLDIHKLYNSKEERNEKVYRILEKVGLSKEHTNRYQHQFSGGQR